MPELPEVESARRIAERTLLGRTLVRVNTADDRIVYSGVTPRTLAAALRGRRVVALRRKGKYLWMELDRRPWPCLQFGMGGHFVVYTAPGQRPLFWKLELVTESGERLAMTNPRRLGRIRLQDDPEHEPPISRLGFDPLLEMPPAAGFTALLARRKAPIKAVLLDQGFAAGVGNWIADEVLYQAGIAPRRLGSDLTADEAKRLRMVLLRVIRRAVDVDAVKERFPADWLFHHRWGRNVDAVTTRGEKIIHETIGGRTTAWVPVAQR